MSAMTNRKIAHQIMVDLGGDDENTWPPGFDKTRDAITTALDDVYQEGYGAGASAARTTKPSRPIGELK